MKYLKVIAASLVAVLTIMLIPQPVQAAEKTLNLETNIDKTLEIPLTLKADTDTFYVDSNINPGDKMTADIVFKNTSKDAIQVRISDVADQLNTTESSALLEVLQLNIKNNGTPIYKGNHKNVTTPLTQWITLNGGSSLTMNVEIEFPLEEADNRFQGSEMKVKYTFEARADVPLDAQTTTTKIPEKLKTGEEGQTQSNPLAVSVIVIAVVLGIGIISLTVVSKKKKNNKNN